MTRGRANAHTGTDTGIWLIDPDPTTEASNIATSINAAGNGSAVGVAATSAGAVVTITATTAGAGGNGIAIGGDVNSVGGGLTEGNANFPAVAPATRSTWAYNVLYVGVRTTSGFQPSA